MKFMCVLVLALALSPLAQAGFSLSGQPEIKQQAYTAQLPVIRDTALKLIKVTGSFPVDQDELSVASLVVDIDFQKTIKVAQGASVLGEYTPWIDLELATWGFQDMVNSADDQIATKIVEYIGGEIYALSEEVESAAATIITFPTPMPALNRKMPNYSKTLVAYESPGFDADDTLKVTKLELADEDTADGAVFFPYVNIALHKQSATTSQMDGELMINYVAAINGYFVLCFKPGCFKASFAQDKYIDLIVPLVHRNEATSEEGQVAARKFGQQFMADAIAELTLVAFEKLTEDTEDEE